MGQTPEEWRARERREDTKAWALYLLVAAVAVAVGWGLYRLDDRSERLFNVVATEQACPCSNRNP